jgi:hypothetical protein
MAEGKLSKHPMQPIEMVDGVARFKRNAIVGYLASGRLNELAALDFPREDWEQLAQLIGYSVSGFGDLSYASEEAIEKADEAVSRATIPVTTQVIHYGKSKRVKSMPKMKLVT